MARLLRPRVGPQVHALKIQDSNRTKPIAQTNQAARDRGIARVVAHAEYHAEAQDKIDRVLSSRV